jgi:hypothetical protein
MQARSGLDTTVLSCVAIGLATLVSCVGVARLTVDVALLPAPSLGEHIRISTTTPGPAWSAKARLPSGAACNIDVGEMADAGGDLYVVTRAADGEVGAIWTSNGRSSATGPDCGNGAAVSLDEQTVSGLALAASGVNPAWSSEYPTVF